MQNEKFSKFATSFKRSSTPIKAGIIVGILAAWLGVLAVLAYAVGSISTVTATATGNKINPILYTFSNKGARAIALGLWLAVTVVLVFELMKSSLRNQIEYTDERGIKYLKNPTKDSTRPMTEAEIRQAFTVGDIKDSTSTIYGRLSPTGTKDVVTWKKKAHGSSGNHNDIVIASMGSGKTSTYVINELVQTILRGDSFVASDPKGELFSTLAAFCKNKGVETHVLDLADDIGHSECWDCLKEVIDPETERIDSTRLNDFVNIFMENSSSDQKKDFWYTSAFNLIAAVIAYIAFKREYAIAKGYAELYKKVANVSDNDEYVTRITETMISFTSVKDTIRRKAAENKYDLGQINKVLSDIENYLPEYKLTIGEVFDMLLKFNDVANDIDADLDSMPVGHPARTAYMMYQTNDTETVRKSALQGAQLRFSLFSDTKLKEVLSHDGIHISDINMKQTAVFVICSDKSDTYKPITSLFFSFFFKDAMNQFDKQEQLAHQEHIPNPCLGITAMLEEFFSIGVISGSANTFGKIMSTCRSRNIYVKVIIQYYGQLEALYGPDIKDAIQGGCSTLIFLGANDLKTCEFIRDFAGSSTILQESHQEMDRKLIGVNSTEATNVSEAVRPFLTVADLRRWKDKVLILKQGEQPAEVYPFFWKDHWVVGKGKPLDPDKLTSIFTWQKPIDVRLEEDAIVHPPVNHAEMETKIENKEIPSLHPIGTPEPELNDHEETENLSVDDVKKAEEQAEKEDKAKAEEAKKSENKSAENSAKSDSTHEKKEKKTDAVSTDDKELGSLTFSYQEGKKPLKDRRKYGGRGRTGKK